MGGDIRLRLNQRLPTTNTLTDSNGDDALLDDLAEIIPEQAETPGPAEPAPADGAEDPSPEPEAESCRCDKYGYPLNPQALYMKYYRSLRSVLSNDMHVYVPENVAIEICMRPVYFTM